MFSTMGKIIFCDDLILRVDDDEDLTNITEWLIESTEYRPASPESCVVRSEMTTSGKIGIILVVWLGLILFTFVYFYFCEWKLFPKRNRLKEMEALGYGVQECIESCPTRANKKHASSSAPVKTGVSCDGTCCNTDLTSHRATSPTWSTSTLRSRLSSTSNSSGYFSTGDLMQLEGSPKRRGTRGRERSDQPSDTSRTVINRQAKGRIRTYRA